jgi:hypothetical protein
VVVDSNNTNFTSYDPFSAERINNAGGKFGLEGVIDEADAHDEYTTGNRESLAPHDNLELENF